MHRVRLIRFGDQSSSIACASAIVVISRRISISFRRRKVTLLVSCRLKSYWEI